MQRRIGRLDAFPQLWLDPRWFAIAISVVALLVGVILGVTSSLTAIALSVLVLVFLDLAVFKQDEALATMIIIISVLLDWYELFWPDFYFPAMTTVAACCFIGIRFLTQSPDRPWVSIPQLRWRVALLILAALPILQSVSILGGIRYYLGVFANAMLLAVVGMLVVRNLASLRRLLSMLSAFGTLVAVQSIIYTRLNIFILANQNLENYLNANQYFRIAGTQINRAGSFLLNPDFNGAFLAMMVFLPVGLFFASSARLAKVFYALEAVILFVALYYTYTLGSLLAVGVGALAFVLIAARSRYRLYIFGALSLSVVGMALFFSSQIQILLQRLSNPREFSLRLGLWETALRVIAAHPLTGIGLGLDTYLLREEPYRVVLQDRAYAQPHESYLEIAAMAGLPVLALFLFILGRSLWAAFRAFRNARGPHKVLIASAITALLVTCVNSLTINDWTLLPLTAIGWLIVGAISSPALARELASDPLSKRATSLSHPGALRLQEQASGFPSYPASVDTLVKMSRNVLAELRISGEAPEQPDGYQPALVAKEALIQWNTYLATGDEQYQSAFLAQATWILEHTTAFAGGVFGWPVLSRVSTLSEPVPLLSASTQGLSLSVLVRAYRLTGDEAFWQMAQGTVRAFEQDIFEGGVSAPIGAEGIFFEEIAAYPAAHHLSACLISLCGLSEYLMVAEDAQIAALVQRCLSTLATLIADFDTGYWSRTDLSSRRLTAPAIHRLHVELLHALAQSSGDDAWAVLAARWEGYQHAFRSRLRYFLASTTGRLQRLFGRWIRRRFFRVAEGAPQESRRKVYVPITAFPVAGGMRSVLAGVAKAMASEWQMEYLTWHIGAHSEGVIVRSFGNTFTAYWQFPNIWLYVFAGWRRLLSLLHQGQRYHLILSQDGVFTGAFAALAARLAGVPVVCMDHGSITLPSSQTYRAERLRALEHASWRSRLIARMRFACYWPSLRLLARVATRTTDCFLAAGEDVEMAYRQQLGVSSGRVIRFPFLIDADHYTLCDALVKAERRGKLHLPADSIVITMINRLSPEKGVDIALQGMSRALEQLPGDVGARVRVIIAGDGPLRAQVEETIRRYHLESACLLWGEATADDVALLLSISDLFLYTATRGINSAAVMEAMSAGLMVIASMEPRWMATLLAEGRGIAIPAGDAEAVSMALVEAVTDLPRCRQMGTVAREYIKTHHNTESLRRCLLRATGWPLAASDVQQVSREDSLMVARQSASFVEERGMFEEGDA